MRKIFAGIVFLFFIFQMAQAQSGKKESLEQEKIAFFTRNMGLTADEAKVFWPVYNEMEKELHAVHEQERKLTDGKKLEELTEEELNTIMDERIALKQKEVDLEKKYQVKFKEILPLKKVAKIYTTQEKWKKHLLDKIRNKNSSPPRPRRR
jgi:glycerol-3-phosphate dehydrogenase